MTNQPNDPILFYDRVFDLQEEYRLILPETSQKAWGRVRSDADLRLNAGLVFDRYCPAWYQEDDKKAGQLKARGLLEVVRAARRAEPELFGALKERWIRGVKALSGCDFRMVTEWRLVTGLGRKGPLEIGFTFHRFGYPYIPGSSVKGIARAAALNELAGGTGLDPAEWENLLLIPDESKFHTAFSKSLPQAGAIQADADLFRLVFGTQDTAGCIVFWDSMPDEFPRLEIDIINPHYPEYYSDKKPPANWQNPKPVYFLTVAPGTVFHFAVGYRPGTDGNAHPGIDPQEKARLWLTGGLKELGAGAKTNAGYGFFEEV